MVCRQERTSAALGNLLPDRDGEGLWICLLGVSKLLQKSTYLKLLSSEQEERCVRGSPLPLLQEGELPSQVWTLDKFHRIPVNKEKLTIFAFLTEVL